MQKVLVPAERYFRRSTCLLLLLFMVMSMRAQIYVGGALTENTTWNDTTQYYIVVQNVTVPKTLTLTINPGVQVLFELNTSLLVSGTLIAAGTQADSILFLPEDGDWNGIQFLSSTTKFDEHLNYVAGSILSFARIENAAFSVVLQDNAGVLIESCKLSNASFGIYIKDAMNNVVRNCAIVNNDFGVFMASSYRARNNIFSNNRVSENLYVGIFVNNSSGMIVKNKFSGNYISNNLVGLYLGNDGPGDAGYNLVSGNVFNHNDFGVRLFQDTSIVERNYIINSAVTGIQIVGAKHSAVRHNLIASNDLYGLAIDEGAQENYISGNSIEHNRNGVYFGRGKSGESVHNQFYANAIHHNSDTALVFRSLPQQNFLFNSIYKNKDTAAIVNLTNMTAIVRQNWWGTSDTNAINTSIYDAFDDTAKGIVDYRPILQLPDTAAPVTAPAFALKISEGNNLRIAWPPNPEPDVAGYRVHYGRFDGFAYEHYIDAGTDTTVLIDGLTVGDTVAVTAHDFLCDGILDRPEGHESDFTMAIRGPWAGSNTQVCYNATLQLEEAIVYSEFDMLRWTTSGDGLFDDSSALHPGYKPGQADLLAGVVTLTLTVFGDGYALSDEMRVKILPQPYVYAGADTTIISGDKVLLSEARADFYLTVQWQSQGDGFFDNPAEPYTYYTPGLLDVINGKAVLVLSAASDCGEAADTLVLSIIQGYSISGRVHAGDNLASGSILNLLRHSGNSYSAIRNTLTTGDGTFTISQLIEGEYLLYAIPGENLQQEFAPAYFFDDIHWENAHKLMTSANTYDVDIDLFKLPVSLPAGTGSISGSCICNGQPASDCHDITLLLFDKTAGYLLQWLRVSASGTFSFSSLPFGEYIILGEKAGYLNSETAVISLTANRPTVEDLQVNIIPFKISIAIPGPLPGDNSGISVQPNPTHDIVKICGLSLSDLQKITIIKSGGRCSELKPGDCRLTDGCLEVSAELLSPGLNIVSLYTLSGPIRNYKIIRF